MEKGSEEYEELWNLIEVISELKWSFENSKNCSTWNFQVGCFSTWIQVESYLQIVDLCRDID